MLLVQITMMSKQVAGFRVYSAATHTHACFYSQRLQVKRVAERLADKKIKLELDESAVSHLASVGYDPVYGAR